MRKIILLFITISLFFSLQLNAQTLLNVKRYTKSQTEIDNMDNFSHVNLQGKDLSGRTFVQKNFSFSNLINADTTDSTFIECNFSWSIGLDKIIANQNTLFDTCNIAGGDLPDAKYMTDCVTTQFSLEELQKTLSSLETKE